MGVGRGYALSAAVLTFVTAGVVTVGVLLHHPAEVAADARAPVRPPAPTSDAAGPPTAEPAVGTHADRREERAFDMTARSTSEASSPWVIVNKRHPIGTPDFRPELRIVRGYQVAAPAAGPLSRMLAAADRNGVGFKIASAFRSYGYQQTVYGNVVASWGQARADQLSARPGFVVRYPAGSMEVTGYAPEPWHVRYVGRPLAAELRRTHTATLEEFFGVTGGDYR